MLVAATEVRTQVEADREALRPESLEARRESVAIAPRSEAEELLDECRVRAQARDWPAVERIAAGAVITHPTLDCFHTRWAWSVYQQGGTLEALEIATRASELFPKSVGVAYALACLHGALQHAPEAKSWLTEAVQRASNPNKVKLRSLVQPELQCVWAESPQSLPRAAIL